MIPNTQKLSSHSLSKRLALLNSSLNKLKPSKVITVVSRISISLSKVMGGSPPIGICATTDIRNSMPPKRKPNSSIPIVAACNSCFVLSSKFSPPTQCKPSYLPCLTYHTQSHPSAFQAYVQ